MDFCEKGGNMNVTEIFKQLIAELGLNSMTPFDIVTQLIGALGIIASIAAFQFKKHGTVLIFRTLNEGFFAVQYFLLAAYTGAAVSVIGITRNLIFKNRIANGKSTSVFIAIFSALFILFGVLTWEGPKSILIIVAKVLSTISYGNKNTTVIRVIGIITTTSWLLYNWYVFSIAGVLCEAFTLTSLIIALLRLDLLPRLSKSKKNSI
jgi:hypothetical protein